MNRAERRRRGLTRSRMARTGSLASAGVLLSVGLFGAYTGSPRIQRAYASGNCAPVGDAALLQLALDDSSITCIEIINSFHLTGQLDPIRAAEWVGSDRDDSGLTIFGSGDYTIYGDGNFGIQLTLNDPNPLLTKPARLSISNLTFTDFIGNNGSALYAYLAGQSQDLFLTMDGVSVTNSSSTRIGGAVYAVATDSSVYVDLTDASFADDTGFAGGAIYISADDTAALEITASTFSDNAAFSGAGSGHGGAIWMKAAGHTHISMDSATSFVRNHAATFGGAVYAHSGSGVYFSATDSAFTDNEAGWGGAIYAWGDDTALTTINSSTFTRNTAQDLFNPSNLVDGGAIFTDTDSYGYAAVNIGQGSRFIDNYATRRGGAVLVGYSPPPQPDGGIGSVSISEDVTFSGNTAGAGGGAIQAQGPVEVSPSGTNPVLFSGNQAGGSGGAISATGPVTVGAGANFEHNTATATQPDPAHGGAIFTTSSLTVTGTADYRVLFADDSATQYGGAIYSKYGAEIVSAMFQHNTAKAGGAVYNWDLGLTIADSTIANNTATSAGGGGVYSGGGSAYLYNSAIVDNTATLSSGGGISVIGGPLVVENSFIGGNYATYRAGGIFMQSGGGDVDLRFSTVYDDTTGTGMATEIYSRNITSTMSVVGSRTTGHIWEFGGTLDDSYSVSTSDDTVFQDPSSGNVTPGSLDFGGLNGTAPGQLGKTPNPTSRLALPVASGGFAPLANPLPLITEDQLGNPRMTPFTIGARSAVVAVAPSVTSVTPATGTTSGGDPITIHGSGFTGATGASIGGTAILNVTVVDDSTITGVTPAGNAGGATVTVTGPGGTGSLSNGFTFEDPNPNPPSPTPAERASAPREVRAEAAVESAKVSWLPPASTGSFPVTSYQAVASPGGQTCMVAAPALTCTITGLTPGKPYTVTARALTGAGWSEASSPSSVVVPLGPEVPTILITNSRDRAQKSMARIEGTTTGLVGAEVVPYLRMTGQTDFTPGASTRTVDAQGNFVWQRKAKKRFTVYFVSGDVTSNRLVIRPE